MDGVSSRSRQLSPLKRKAWLFNVVTAMTAMSTVKTAISRDLSSPPTTRRPGETVLGSTSSVSVLMR